MSITVSERPTERLQMSCQMDQKFRTQRYSVYCCVCVWDKEMQQFLQKENFSMFLIGKIKFRILFRFDWGAPKRPIQKNTVQNWCDSCQNVVAFTLMWFWTLWQKIRGSSVPGPQNFTTKDCNRRFSLKCFSRPRKDNRGDIRLSSAPDDKSTDCHVGNQFIEPPPDCADLFFAHFINIY